ncbi:hypothetical protein E8E11_001547 [Didymella keratinophila]|nr:hypothetical protein E8E11_001547 [Didymella keratinophila]
MAMLELISLTFVTAGLVSAGWTNTDFETTLHCTTQYAPQNNASSIDTNWLTTETQTTTESLWFAKTEIYTPKASTTTLPAIATSYDQSLIDEWTSIITTATVTSSVTLKTITAAIVAATTTTILAAEYPNSNKPKDCSPPAVSTHVKNKNNWEVADVYWTADAGAESPEAHNRTSPTKSGDIPVKVDCTLSTLSNNFWTTVTIKQSRLTPTYTHTTLIATETSTLIARTSRDKYESAPASIETWEWNYVTWVTVHQTSTTAATVTVTTDTDYTATILPKPCDYDEGIFDAHHRFGLSSLDTGGLAEIFYHYKYNNNGKTYQSGSACCEEAAREPRAVAWYQQPYSGCSIYIGEHCSSTNGTLEGRRSDRATVYYDTTPGFEDTTYGSVGGGQCGDLAFVNVWA